MDITFLGATGTVTGSKYLIMSGPTRVLVDCGLFQGFKQLRLRNWAPLPIAPQHIEAVILTHAHLDHSGYLPLLIKSGFMGTVYCSEATRDLCAILLPDGGRLQEEEAAYANRHGYAKHRPALPLYTQADAEAALQRCIPVAFDADVDLRGGLSFRLSRAGHIVGAACVSLRDHRTSIVFSGDLGRPSDPIMPAPTVLHSADYLVIESTYGDRRHDPTDPQTTLAEVIHRTVARGGVIVIPAFAVGRAQTMLYYLQRLKAAAAIPNIPVFLDSPMAVNATRVLCKHWREHRLTPEQCEAVCGVAHIVNSVEASRALSRRSDPMIIISASGMATGGRVLHHLKAFAPEPRNTILLVGFQAGGTRGAAMLHGAVSVKIHGAYVPVRAEVVLLANVSAHADADEILAWLAHVEVPPRRTFVTHGEPAAAGALHQRIEAQLGWACRVPEYQDTQTLS